MLLQLAANYAETAGIIGCTSSYTAFTRYIIEMEPFSIINRLHNTLSTKHNTVLISIYQLSQNLLQLLCCEFVGSFHAPAAKDIISMMVMMMVIMVVVMTTAIRIMALLLMMMVFMFVVMVMFMIVATALMIVVVMLVVMLMMVTALMVMMMLMVMLMMFLHIL